YVIGGAGLATILVGTALGVSALSQQDVVDRHCDKLTRLCDPQGADAASSGEALSIGSNVAWVVGGLALATGAYLVISDHWDSKRDTALVPTLMPSGAGVAMSRSF